MKRLITSVLLVASMALGGCVVVQGSYDSYARSECADIPNAQDRLDCERAVAEAQQRRRAEDLREN